MDDPRSGGDDAARRFPAWPSGSFFPIVLVYLLMVVNFQSWVDPFIIITALPGALAGIVWMLFFTGTTLNVPSLMGAIMCIGVATSNSILLVTFAGAEMQGRQEFLRGGGRRRIHAASPGAHDRAGHDRRDDSDVAGHRRGRRAECAAGTRGDRRACCSPPSPRCSSCRWFTASSGVRDIPNARGVRLSREMRRVRGATF